MNNIYAMPNKKLKEQVLKTPEQIRDDKLRHKYPNAKIISSGSFAHEEDALQKKIDRLNKMLEEKDMLGGVQKGKFDEFQRRFKDQSEKIDEEMAVQAKFWMGKRVELLHECIDGQLEILNQKIAI